MLLAQMIFLVTFLIFNNSILEDIIVLNKIQLVTLIFVKKVSENAKNLKFSNNAYFCSGISKLQNIVNEQSSYKKQQ